MKRLITAALAMAILTGCGHTEPSQTASEQPVTTIAETTIEAETTATMESTTAALAEPEYTDNDVNAAQNWLTGIWNHCVDISAYVERGTDCTGNEIDMELYIEGAKIDYEKKEQYDAVIHALDDSVSEQKMLIMAWDKCIEQADALLSKAFNEIPRSKDENYEFDIELFRQHFKQFGDSLNTVKYGDSNTVSVGVGDSEQKFTFK